MENDAQDGAPIGPRWFSRLAEYMAYAGGLAIIGVLLVSVASILGRALFGKPILGDFEIVERVVAVSVAWFLPYSQLAGGHVLVDFFTRHMRGRKRAVLDAFANVLVLIAVVLLTWRTVVGLFEQVEQKEISMILGVPAWIPVAFIIPGLLGFAVATAISIQNSLREVRS